MSICWSENTKFHGKTRFPYRQAALLSSELWTLISHHAVILQIVYNVKDESNSSLHRYADSLSEIGVRVHLVANDPEVMDCALKSQLQRMFAHKLGLDDRDLIVTADVDSFVMSPELLRPLKRNPSTLGWIFQFHFAVKFGGTFPMDNLAFSAKLWRQMLAVETAEELVRKHASILDPNITWDYDQIIVTRMILEFGICSLPKGHKKWSKVGLNPSIYAHDDSDVCFHGSDQYRTCNKHGAAPEQGCLKWHFDADDDKAVLWEKYAKIIALTQD